MNLRVEARYALDGMSAFRQAASLGAQRRMFPC